MRFKQLSLTTAVFSLLSASVSAQQELTGPLGDAGRLIGDILGGIFQGIAARPEIWMKVIICVGLFAVLFSALNKIALFKDRKSGATILSVVLSIGAIAPLPDELIVNLFGLSGFVGSLLIALPIALMMYWTYDFTHDKKEAWRYLLFLFLWFIMLSIIGAAQATIRVAGLNTAKGIGALICVSYIIFCAFGAIGSVKHTKDPYMPAEGAREVGSAGKRTGGFVKRMFGRAPPSAETSDKLKRAAANAMGFVGNIQAELPNLNAALANADTVPDNEPIPHAVARMDNVGVELNKIQQLITNLYIYLHPLATSKELKRELDKMKPSKQARSIFQDLFSITQQTYQLSQLNFTKLADEDREQQNRPHQTQNKARDIALLYGKHGPAENVLKNILAVVNTFSESSTEPRPSGSLSTV